MIAFALFPELLAALHASEESFRAAENEVDSPELRARFRDWIDERRAFSASLLALAPLINAPRNPPCAIRGGEGRKTEDPLEGDTATLLYCRRTELATIDAYERFLHQPSLGDEVILQVHAQYLKVRSAYDELAASAPALLL